MQLSQCQLLPNQSILISGSKSESNRLLVLQKLFGNIHISNLSDAQDTALLQRALASEKEVIDIHHAGTAMRFLTAYFAIQEGKTTLLTGSERMKQRPIHPLVTALQDLGADIEYMENKGFPPLKIRGKRLTGNFVEIPANVSSQFISALMLIGGILENGLRIQLIGNITSRPYLEMTAKLINSTFPQKQKGVSFEGNIIVIPKISKPQFQTLNSIVESDWSSASYFYSMVAIGRQAISLQSFKPNSLQGDFILTKIYRDFFGIETIFKANESIELHPMESFSFPKNITLDMNDCPDIAQTLCVTASALRIPFHITGLETLKVKETDRLLALQKELIKIGITTKITNDSIQSSSFSEPKLPISIATYNDHRMAMSFAPMALLLPIEIQHPEVVEKSYPKFWEDFKHITQNL